MRIFYLTDGLHESGGQLVNLDHVEALRAFGYDARYLVIPRPGGPEAAVFPAGREVPWRVGPEGLAPDDVVVVGEMHGAGAKAVAGTPARKLIHNQNPFYSFVAFRDLGVVRDWGCEGVLTPSGFTAGMLRRIGWRAPLWTVRPFVDPVFAAAPPARDKLRIAAMPRKRPQDYAFIRGVVRSRRPDLPVAFHRIEGRTRAEAAHILAACDLFLSLSHNEGLGLPPLEAMAAGCLVVGFHGGGGTEYATPENGDWFDDGQPLEVADRLVERLDQLAAGETFDARREAGRRTAAEFSRERFEADLRSAWLQIAGAP